MKAEDYRVGDRVVITGEDLTFYLGRCATVVEGRYKVEEGRIWIMIDGETSPVHANVKDFKLEPPRPESLEEKRARLLEELEQVDGEIKERDKVKASDLDVGNMVHTQRNADRSDSSILYVKVAPNSWKLVVSDVMDKITVHSDLVYYDYEVQVYMYDPKYKAVVIKP